MLMVSVAVANAFRGRLEGVQPLHLGFLAIRLGTSRRKSQDDLQQKHAPCSLCITADRQNAQMWMGMSESDRQTVLDQYHAAGIALMVSAFGSTGE